MRVDIAKFETGSYGNTSTVTSGTFKVSFQVKVNIKNVYTFLNIYFKYLYNMKQYFNVIILN